MIIPGVLASSQKGGFAPPPVAGYSLWLDGKDPTAFTFSSSNVVSSWLDKSGNAYNFSQGTVAYQPTRNVTSGLVTFDGSNDNLIAGSKFMNNMHNGGANTLFMVYRNNDYTITGGLMDTGINAGGDIGWGAISYDATRLKNIVNNGTNRAVDADNNPQAAEDVTQLQIVRLDANEATTANRAYWYLNTGSASQTNSLSNGVSSADSSYNPVLGSFGSTGLGLNAAVSFGEVMWFTSDLSTTDRNLVRDWLIGKWGI